MKKIITISILGTIFTILVIIVIVTFIAPINYAPIYLLNPEKALSLQDSVAIDSIKCLHVEVLKDLESKGILLTPDEYTSHIADYYNTLIAFLLGLFVLFTIGSIYSLKSAYKKEFDEINTSIDNYKSQVKTELKKDIVDSLNELMRDSISFKECCINALYGRIEDEVINHDDKEIIDERITKLEEDIKLLYDSYDDIFEHKTSNQELE